MCPISGGQHQLPFDHQCREENLIKESMTVREDGESSIRQWW